MGGVATEAWAWLPHLAAWQASGQMWRVVLGGEPHGVAGMPLSGGAQQHDRVSNVQAPNDLLNRSRLGYPGVRPIAQPCPVREGALACVPGTAAAVRSAAARASASGLFGASAARARPASARAASARAARALASAAVL